MNLQESEWVLLAIIGPDGAGKTTLAKSIVEKLQARSYRAKYVWGRFESPILAYALKTLRKVFGISNDLHESYAKRLYEKTRLLRYRTVRTAYLLFVVLSYIPRIHRLSRPMTRDATIVVADRYVHDTVVDLWIDFGGDFHELMSLLHLFQRLSPKPHLTFLLEVPEEVSVARKDDITCIEYVASRRRGYLEMANHTTLIKLDGTMEVNVNSSLIQDMIVKSVEKSERQ